MNNLNFNTMTKGKVKWYNEVKGFGFISMDNGEDIFVHRSSLNSPFAGLEPGQEVSFDTRRSDKGMIAVNVSTLV
jgi:CspA family cold shock protein